MKNDTEPQRSVKSTAGIGILFKLCCTLSSNSCSCTQMEKHLVRKQQISVFQDRIQLPKLLRLHSSRFYFFFAMTFLQTQFMPSFEGNGQRKAVLVIRQTLYTQAQEGRAGGGGSPPLPPAPASLSQGHTWVTRDSDLVGRPLRAQEGERSGSARCLNLRWVLRNSL